MDEKDLINLANDTLNDTLSLIKINSKIKQKEIAERLQLFEITVKKNIKILKDKGYIERVGAKKNGYWVIKSDK